MYVQCERCQAEYEFDDALVSERGTTVKCTSCGHQFKIRRAGAGDGDRWLVTTEAGAQHVFSSLKELQRAIIARTVSKNDKLSRGNAPPRPLASIAELEPFFEERRKRNPSIPDRASTRPPPPLPARASMPAARAPVHSDQPRTGSRPSIPPPVPPVRTSRRPSGTNEVVSNVTVTPAPTPAPANANGQEAGVGAGQWSGDDTPTHAIVRREPAATVPPVAAKPPPQTSKGPPRPPPPRREEVEMSSPLPPVASDAQRVSASDQLRGRPSYIDAPYSSPARRRVGGWVVGVGLVAGVIAVGFYMSKRNSEASTAQTSAKTDPRAQQFLAAGESALAQGNLELAKENLDKASALSEQSPDVLLATARLAAARADLAWLRFKIVPPDSDESRLAKQALDDLASVARRAADEAQKTTPDDMGLVRTRIDVLRTGGDVRAARALVDRILPTGNQPETAYVLAALDLAEADPPWSVVISRLRTAAASEGTASRARAALVYTLARAGDGPEARKELDRLAAQPRVHPLLGSLRAFVDRASPAVDGGAAKSPEVAAIDISKLPNQGAATTPPAGAGDKTPRSGGERPTADRPTGETPGGAAPAPAALPSDPRTLIRQAEAAKNKRDFERARTLYEAALAKSPSDSEALSGMGDVSRSTGDAAAAQSFYKRALGANPSYLPALVALADLQWDSGDKAAAQKAYRDIVDRFPEPAFPARVKQRAESSGQ